MGNEGGPGPVGGAGNGSGAADSAETESPTGERPGADPPETSTCGTCWRQIPADRVRCQHCFGSGGTDEDDPAAWTYDRLVLAVVPADGGGEARATAVTAFERGRPLVGGPGVSHGEVTLRAAVETEPPDALTEGWPELSRAVPVTSSAGQSLFEAAAARCEGTEPIDPVIYCEDGATVEDGDAVETLSEVIEEADVQYWVVPGVVRRYRLPEEPDAFGDPLYCADCGAVTEHDPCDRDTDAAARPVRPRWVCRVCETRRDGPD
jgi:hypothetical protein